ncbi:maltose acetyltransferase domain-containing protein [Liquorilactobacillus aquaticus]|uniref:maltose acetyltransferase domain-containing protein n=1 Tax=Liquorilactobacillus aquaticus TaxID=392566 RepID=UPI0009FB035F
MRQKTKKRVYKYNQTTPQAAATRDQLLNKMVDLPELSSLHTWTAVSLFVLASQLIILQ